MLVALATMASLLFNREPKRVPIAAIALSLLFAGGVVGAIHGSVLVWLLAMDSDENAS